MKSFLTYTTTITTKTTQHSYNFVRIELGQTQNPT